MHPLSRGVGLHKRKRSEKLSTRHCIRLVNQIGLRFVKTRTEKARTDFFSNSYQVAKL